MRIGPGTWTVVGVFDADGSAFDSEVWADADVLNANYQRPPGIYQSITARLRDPSAFDRVRGAARRGDPRARVQVLREREYYASQSRLVTTLITVLGGLVAAVMAIGAVLAALNTMYSAVTERSREIALLRALGFGGPAIVFSFLAESLLIAGLGGAIGCLAALPLNGLTTGTLNWQTFSHLAFAFRITPELLGVGHGIRAGHGRRRRPAAGDPRGEIERGADAPGPLTLCGSTGQRPRRLRFYGEGQAGLLPMTVTVAPMASARRAPGASSNRAAGH